jgi:hypothetical protein
MVGAVNLLFIAELVDWLGFRTVRETPQCPWKRECDVAGIFALAERLPFGVLAAIEDFCQIARLVKLGITLQRR